MSEKKHQSVAVIEKGELAPQIHPLQMVAQAVERGLDPDTISKLMDLADRHAATEARKAFTQALVDLKKDLPTVLDRDQTVDFSSKTGSRVYYTHTSLAAVMDAVTEPLTRYGFALSWVPSTEGQTVRVTCRLTHSQGHVEEATLTAPVDRSGSKSDAQGIASTITLMQRYTALSLLGIATADMPEPKGETPPEHIDNARNRRAVSACVRAGHTKQDAEKKVGKPAEEWTAADLDVLRTWLGLDGAKKKAKEEPKAESPDDQGQFNYGPPPLSDEEAASMREPGED